VNKVNELKKLKSKSNIETIIKYIICCLFAFLVVVPLYIAVSGGFKGLGQLNVDPIGIPQPLVWQNYTRIVTGEVSHFMNYLKNTMIIMCFTVLFDLFLASCAGFALSRFKFKGREVIFNYFILGLLFPLTIAILPLYIQIRSLNLLNTHMGVILPQVAFQMPFHILLFRTFFRDIPNELEDACTIDGCGKLGFLLNIVIPLSKPVIATVCVLSIIFSWNGYFLPLIILNDLENFTLPMGIFDFFGQYMTEWNMILAFITLAMIPAVIFYFLAQKYIVAGLTSGAIKS